MPIKPKIIILSSLLVLMATASVFLSSLFIFNSTEKNNIKKLIMAADATLESTIANLERKAINETSLIAKIPKLEEVIARADKSELITNAKSFQEDFLVNIVDFYDTSGKILISLPASEQQSGLKDFEPPEHLVSKSLEGKIGVDYVMREGKMAMIASAPIGPASKPLGIIVTGYYVDDQVAIMLKQQTQADISIFNLDNQITASSLPDEQKEGLINVVVKNTSNLLKSAEVRTSNFIIKPYDLLNKDDDDLGFAIIQLSLDDSKETMQTFYKYMIASGIIGLMIAIIFAILIAAHIANPIVRLKEFTSQLIASNDLSSRASLRGSKEVLSLQKSFNHLLDDIDAKHKKLEEYSKGLEALVDERTYELRQEKNMIARILEHIELGICVLDKKMQFSEQFSSYFAKFYDISAEEIKSCKRPIELLFPQIEAGADMINLQQESLFASLGETAFTWDLNSDHLLEEAVIKPAGKRKVVQVWWTPIIEDDSITEVMITIKDVTDQRKLEEQVAKQKKESSKKLGVITELIAKDKSFVRLFFQDSCKRMEEVIKQVHGERIDPEAVFVNLHTIKGSSRALGFKAISDLAHQSEELVQKLRAGEPIDDDNLRQDVEKVKLELEYYHKTFDNVMGGDVQSAESLSVHAALSQHLATIKENTSKAKHSLAAISVNDEILYWQQENFRHVVGVFVHGVNNAIDHGYLRPKKANAAVDPIRLNLHAYAVDNLHINLELRDFGFGINFAKIKEIIKGSKPDINTDELSDDDLAAFLLGVYKS